MIEIGLKHVKKIGNIEMRKDAALAIAIAFFEKAREASASDISSISDACEYLNYVLNTIDEFSLDSETSKELNYETENLLKSLRTSFSTSCSSESGCDPRFTHNCLFLKP